CNTTQEVTGAVPMSYRQRHPIAIKEGPRTLEVFIGSKRGGLTAAQRAEVIGFAGAWRREATGGILIDLPTGTSNETAATSALPEVRALLAAGGVPPEGVAVRPARPSDPGKLLPLRLQYPTMVA